MGSFGANAISLATEVFRKVSLTESDFVQLQSELQPVNLSRSSAPYTAMDVSTSKLLFLHSRSSVDEEAIAYFAAGDAASDGQLALSNGVDIETVEGCNQGPRYQIISRSNRPEVVD